MRQFHYGYVSVLGKGARLDYSAALSIVGLIQALLNNPMPHAARPDVFVQLLGESNRLISYGVNGTRL